MDNDSAVVWIQRAAAQGNADGQYNLAYLYETGEGVPQDEDEAYRLYSLAAAQGHEGAIQRLSPLYGKRPGNGVIDRRGEGLLGVEFRPGRWV